MAEPIPLALVGIGKIARDQHLPAITADPDLLLVASVSRNQRMEGVESFSEIETFLRDGPEAAVSLCVPPKARTSMALKAIASGRDVVLEKPPASTLGEVETLLAVARARGVSLFATWHSRFAAAVAPAKAWLEAREVRDVRIVWKEDVRRWHPGQAWIWQPGGFGVFDPGINALSILTEILPGPYVVERARLVFPANRATPIAANLAMTGVTGHQVSAVFDWRQRGPQTWDIAVETDGGRLELAQGGAVMRINGAEVPCEGQGEYPAIYRRFVELVRTRDSDADPAPLRIVADTFLIGEREITEPFDE